MSSLREAHGWLRLAVGAATLALVGFIVVALAWRLQGGRWERVESPSMGTVAPVGSLLWVEPVDFASLRPGDFITFRPPGSAQTYSHRVLTREPDGSLTTKGVIPGPDPWHLTADDVVGEVRSTWWGAGWLVTAAPVLLIGGLVVGLVRSLLRPTVRLPATLVLGSTVVAVALTVYHPLIGAQQLAFAPDDAGGATATYVGTGLLPIRLQEPGGTSVVMRAGEVGTVHVAPSTPQGPLSVSLHPALPGWWWVPVVVACFLPALLSTARTVVRTRRRGTHRGGGHHLAVSG